MASSQVGYALTQLQIGAGAGLAYYTRPVYELKTQDGVSSTITQEYETLVDNGLAGFPKAGTVTNYNANQELETIRTETLYAVQPVPCDPVVGEKAFRLRKADGTLYDVSQTHFGPECDCPDFIFRRDGLDPAGCKHVRALVRHGLIGS